MVSEPGSLSWCLASANHHKAILITDPNHRSCSSRFSLFKKKVYEAMVVLYGCSSPLLSIKGVAQLISKLKSVKKKAFSWILKLVTWKAEESWSLLCCG